MKTNKLLSTMNKKQAAGFIGMVLFMILMALYFYFGTIHNISKKDGSIIFQRKEIKDEICEISEGEEIIQSYTPTREQITRIGFRFMTEGDVSDVNVHVKLQDRASKKLIQEWKFDAAIILNDEQYTYFYFPEVLYGVIDRTLEFIISVENTTDDNRVMLLKCHEKNSYGTLEVDGQEESGNLALEIRGRVEFVAKIFWVVIIGFILVGGVLHWKLFISPDFAMEKIFLLIGGFLFLVYLGLFTPYTEPDGTAHNATVLYHTDNVLGEAQLDEDGRLLTTEDLSKQGGFSPYPSLGNYNKAKEKLFSRQAGTKEYAYDLGPLSAKITSYLPQVLGMVLGNLAHLGAVPVLYLAKFFAGLFYLLCGYYAIKKIPFGKLTLLVCELLPISLELGTSASYDCTILGLSFLIISYLLYCIYEKEYITWKDIIVIALLNAWLAPVKVAYILLSSLCIFIPAYKYKNSMNKVCKSAFMMITGLVSIMISRLGFISGIFYSDPSETVCYTLSDILSDPLNSFIVLINTIVTRVPEYIQSIFGGIYSWYVLYLPWSIVIGYLLITLLSAIRCEQEKEYIDNKIRWWIFTLAIIMTGGIVLALWLVYTPKGHMTIEGVQGRYFLPYLPLILYMLRNKVIVLKKNIDKGLIVAFYLLQYVTVGLIFTSIIVR